MKSNLTLNIGVRWELNSPYIDKYNTISSFNLATGQIDIAGRNGFPRSFYPWDYKKVAPRFGFAYSPFGNTKTVIRGGAGIFYDNLITFNGFSGVNFNPPFRAPANYTSSLLSPVTLNNPYPTGSSSSKPAVYGLSPNYTTPTVYQWSFGVQRQLPSNMLLEANYIGSAGAYLPVTLNPNQPPPGVGAAAQVQARRPFPTYSSISMYTDWAHSDYQSLQIKLEKHYDKGISILLAETFAKSIDDSAQTGSTSASSNGTPQNSFNIQEGERGLSDFNVKNRFVLSVVNELPFGKGKQWLSSGWGAMLAGGWQITGIFADQTGRPWTPYFTADNSNTQGGADRPNVVAGCDFYGGFHTVQRWANTGCFTTPAFGTFGNIGCNTLTGPGLVNLDFALDRNFQITERWRLQFRAEAFNIFNHPNFNLPATAFDSASFASLTTAMDPREVQFGLKLLF